MTETRTHWALQGKTGPDRWYDIALYDTATRAASNSLWRDGSGDYRLIKRTTTIIEEEIK